MESLLGFLRLMLHSHPALKFSLSFTPIFLVIALHSGGPLKAWPFLFAIALGVALSFLVIFLFHKDKCKRITGSTDSSKLREFYKIDASYRHHPLSDQKRLYEKHFGTNKSI